MAVASRRQGGHGGDGRRFAATRWSQLIMPCFYTSTVCVPFCCCLPGGGRRVERSKRLPGWPLKEKNRPLGACLPDLMRGLPGLCGRRMHLTRLPAWPFTRILRARQDAKKNERRNQLGVMEQNEPFPNPASKLPNLNFSVYAMVDCAPSFVGSVDAPRRVRGRLCFHFSCTEEARSGVCFTERAFSKTRILVPFFWTKTCDFFL